MQSSQIAVCEIINNLKGKNKSLNLEYVYFMMCICLFVTFNTSRNVRVFVHIVKNLRWKFKPNLLKYSKS